MSKTYYQIRGKINQRQLGIDTSKLRVEVWDIDCFFDDFLAESSPNSLGEFQVSIESNRFKEIFLDHQPDLYFKVFLSGKLIKSTEDSVLWNVLDDTSEIVIDLDGIAPPTSPDEGDRSSGKFLVKGILMDLNRRPLNDFSIRAFFQGQSHEEPLGQVKTDIKGYFEISNSPQNLSQTEKVRHSLIVRAYDANGILVAQSPVITKPSPITEVNLIMANDIRWVSGTVKDDSGRLLFNLLVRAYDRDLRWEEPLGEARSDAKGTFKIYYHPGQFKRAEKASADLCIRVFGDDGKELAVSETMFNASPLAVIDLSVPRIAALGDSEWERYLRELSPLLEKLQLHELTDEDLKFLHGDTGIAMGHLFVLRQASRWQKAQSEHKVPAEAFYGLLRQGHTPEWDLLLKAGASRWRAALTQAVAARQVPATLTRDIKSIVAKLGELALELSLKEPVGEGNTKHRPVGQLLAGSGLSVDVQRQIAGILLERNRDGDPEDLLIALSDAGVAPEAIKTTRFALEADALLGGHVPTLRILQSGPARRFGEAKELASLTRPEWMQIGNRAAESGSLPKGFSDADIYGEYLADAIEIVFPSAAVMYRLLEDAQPKRRDVGLFMASNPDFDLLRSGVDEALEKADLHNVNMPPDQLADQLRKEVAVARMVPNIRRAEYMSAMMANGFDSAVKVSRTGKSEFRRLIGSSIKVEVADNIFANAQERDKAVVAVTLGLKDRLGGFSPMLPETLIRGAAPNGRLARWSELFGSGNGCECPPCESAHGPGAYLVEMLEFLDAVDAKKPAGGETLAGILRQRRPDLWHLKLDCANAELPLPYIDLVIEHLERLVMGLPSGRLNYGAESTPQTASGEGTAEMRAAELRAEPDPSNSLGVAVYGGPSLPGPLQNSVYPWHLPFDRAFERIRIDLDLLGTPAAEVLEVFGVGGEALARARLGLNPATWDRLKEPATDESAVLQAWGVSTWQMLVLQIGDKGRLLDRSGLEVGDLYGLLKSPPFAGWGLEIDGGDDPCDASRHSLRKLNSEGDLVELGVPEMINVFDLLHRVLRLRLRMGWNTETIVSVLQALHVRSTDTRMDLVVIARLVVLAHGFALPPGDLARRMVALDQTAADTGSAAFKMARSRWLALLNISAGQYLDLTSLGCADSIAGLPDGDRLVNMESMQEDWALLSRTGIASDELRFLLADQDQIPPNFDLTDSEVDRCLDSLVAAIHTAPGSDVAGDLLVLQTNAALQSLYEITGTSFVSRIAADIADAPAALLRSRTAIAQPLVYDFIALENAGSDMDELRRNARTSLLRCIKTCRLLTLLRFNPDDIAALAALPPTHPMAFDFNLLPVDIGDAALPFAGIRPLLEISDLQSSISARETSLLKVAASGWLEAPAVLDRQTGWGSSIAPVISPATLPDGASALQTLAGILSPGTSPSEFWQNPANYRKLKRLVFWLRDRRLQPGDAPILLSCASGNGDATSLTAIVQRGFANASEHRKALAPAMDRLRVRQRDALLAHLIHQNRVGWSTADHVYASLLIDVQMGPCQLTSRLVQAHSAVQLFVMRCLQNLESDTVLLGDTSNIAHWRQWDWLKHFRVWEAARKVCLYPENWIEPDLRIGKSPIFEEAEDEILQGEITPERVERTVRNYLAKLHEVSKLDIRAIFEELYDEPMSDGTTAPRRLIHMVGRTQSNPHIYYYRKRNNDLSWTPFEKIELSIDADHLVLAVHNRRPMLFWPRWQEVQVDRGDPPKTAWEMSLNMSTFEFGQWSAPSISESTVVLTENDKHTLSMRPQLIDGAIVILLYKGFYRLDTRDPSSSYGWELASNSFRVDACTGGIRSERLRNLKVRFMPYGVSPSMQSMAESLIGRSASTYLLSGIDSEEEMDFEVSETAYRDLMSSMEELEGVAQCVGICLAPIMVAAGHVDRLRALGSTARTLELFRASVEGFRVVPCQQYAQFNDKQPYVLQYEGRQIFALQKRKVNRSKDVFGRAVKFGRIVKTGEVYILESGEHPFICELLEAIRAEGLDGIFRPGERALLTLVVPANNRTHPRQLTERNHDWVENDLKPNPRMVTSPYPFDEFDFSPMGAFSLYNWELFFHMPLMWAEQFRKNRRFEDAQRWYHAIFDPTDVSPHEAPEKYWRVKPFFVSSKEWDGPAESLEAMMRRLWSGSADVVEQIAQWRSDPFNPHALALLRMIAYMKTVVQKYVENLIDWADSLFRRDTMESTNEATQLYMLAGHILGDAPVILPPRKRRPLSYEELSRGEDLDEFSNALIDIESGMPLDSAGVSEGAPTPPASSMLYFCIPGNPRLRELRLKVADRLFKLRHCMDIEGRTRQLALFSPPIDPALLVRARAAGLDIGTALDMALQSRRTHYRFQPILQKALEFCGEVRSFGSALLSALEKRDGEQLSQLRARHEVGLLKLGSVVKRQQIQEAESNLEAIRKSRVMAEARFDFYNSRGFMNASEESQIGNLSAAHVIQTVAESFNLSAAVSYAFPDSSVGPMGVVTYGGTYIGNSLKTAGGVLNIVASQFSFAANLSAIIGGYQRREDDWKFQADLAIKELSQIDKQIIASEIRLAIAEQDQRNHERQLEQSQEAEAMFRDKFTNSQLYNWMSSQLASLHYQSYRMAFDLAKQAEAAALYELEVEGATIGADHWDSGRKGLLAGERLGQDLRHLEIAYMQANTRRLEITSNISLRRLVPEALWALRLLGHCNFNLPAWLFDMDFPGQRLRKIKSVSISVPGVVGPYGGVNGILRCVSDDVPRTIATSSGQNDAGVFQLDFRDERYLPFEGVSLDSESEWEFILPAVFRSFDYETISDLILHIQYTALEGSDTEKDDKKAYVRNALRDSANPALQLLISVRHDFPVESRLLREAADLEMTRRIDLDERLFPYFARTGYQIQKVLGLSSEPGEVGEEVPLDDGGIVLGPSDADKYFIIEYSLSEHA